MLRADLVTLAALLVALGVAGVVLAYVAFPYRGRVPQHGRTALARVAVLVGRLRDHVVTSRRAWSRPRPSPRRR